MGAKSGLFTGRLSWRKRSARWTNTAGTSCRWAISRRGSRSRRRRCTTTSMVSSGLRRMLRIARGRDARRRDGARHRRQERRRRGARNGAGTPRVPESASRSRRSDRRCAAEARPRVERRCRSRREDVPAGAPGLRPRSRLSLARTTRPAQRHPRIRNARTPRRIRTAARRRSQLRVVDRVADRWHSRRCVDRAVELRFTAAVGSCWFGPARAIPGRSAGDIPVAGWPSPTRPHIRLDRVSAARSKVH